MWFACGVSVAIAAMASFPTLAGRGVVVPGFEALLDAEDGRAASGRLAAGFVMDEVFAATDLFQLVLAPPTVLLAIWCWRRQRGGAAGGLALSVLLLVSVACGLTLAHSLSIAPSMNASLEEYRTLLGSGRLEEALAVHDAFDSRHALADRLYGIRLAAVAIALPLCLFLPGRGGPP